VFAWSEVSSWSSCTGVAVCCTGIVAPSFMFGWSGVPGVRSTKKLPSRNRRGRIFAVASLCNGSASWEICIVTTAASLSPPTWLTSVT